MWASQLPQDFRVLRSDETSSQNAEIANRIFQYEEYTRPSVDPEALGALTRQIPFDNPLLVQKLERLVSDSVVLSPRDKEAVRRFLSEGCWEGMSATDVRAIQKLLAQALSPIQQTQMGLAIDDIRQITHVQSLMGTRHEPRAEMAAQMRDELLSSYGISESEQKFRSSMHLIDVQADGVRVLADELLRTGQLTRQSSLTEIAEKSLSLVQNRFQYIKEATDPDGTEQDRWQSIDETMRKGGGDCEDLAMLQASLLMNLMEQMGYSKKEIRDRVYISGGYMSDAAGNQKGHVLVRLQMNDGDLALDATGDKAPQRFDSLNFDVVFEANDWKFNALQTIDPAFVTSLDVTGSTPDSIVSRINDVMEALQEQLKTRIDIPLPKTDYSSGAADFFGFGTEDIMQREILDADGRGTGNMQDIYSTTEFSFFTLHYSTYSPPFVNNRMYLAEIKEDFFLNYINMTRNLTNELLMLYHIGNSYLDFIANEATEIGMSGYDDQTRGAMQEVMDSGDKYKGKVVGALNSYLQKSNQYIQKVASDIFGFVDSNNSAQLQMAQYKIDNWGRESLFTALPSAIVDQLTNALQMERIVSKVAITEKVAKMAANNMTSYINYSKDMTEGVRFWTEGTSQAEVVEPGALNFGQVIWNEMETSGGSKAQYLAYLDKMQVQVDQIKSAMSSSPSYTATYGLTQADLNKDPLQGELFGAHGDANQFVQTNMDQMAKLYQHNVEFQNMVGIAFMIRQFMQDAQRELASSISGKKGTSSSGQLGSVALSALGAELSKQSTSLNLIQSAAGALSSQATDLMTQRINYEKEVRTTIAKAVKWAVEIAGSIVGAVLGATAGVAAAVGYSFAYASPWIALMSNPFTLAAGIAGFTSSLAAALPVYTDLWTDYFERNTSNTVSAIAELVYSGVQYDSELKSKEIGTTRFIQEGDTFGREENGASDAGAALAAAEQSNTDIWSEGEREYMVNSTEAKLLMARDSYNMRVNESIHIGGAANGTASGTRNTQRTEFIADRGDGQVLLNGLLMGSRESETAMLQGSVYAMMGIFQAQRDAMENIISQAFGVQKANKSSAMGQQIGYSVGLEQQLISMYKQDSNQRIQAMNMLANEDKRQTDLIKEMVTKGLKVGIAALGWANVPIPLLSPVPTPTATAVYHGFNSVINVLNAVIELGDALYKYDLGPYSANFASYHDRSLNSSEDAYRDELKAAVTDPVPEASGLTTRERYERLDQLENQQLAKMIDYGGGIGEWGSNLHDDSILEYSNELAEGITLPFRQVNYGNASRVYNEVTEITSLRVFYAMIEQALYQQKQNTLRLMLGTSSSAGHLKTMMDIIDSYNGAVLNGTYDSLLQEAGSRATSSNAYENNTVSKSIEYAVVGATLLVNMPTLFRFAKVGFGGTGYAGAQANSKALARAGSALKLAGAAAKMTFGFMLMYTVKGSNPNVDSAMASYDEDEEGNPTEKDVKDKEQKITRSSGGQQRVSAAEKTRAQTLARRRERQITLMREIGLALDNATADAAEDVGGISSSKSFNSITKIIGTMASADVKQADFTYQALKQQADAYNAGVQKVVEGAAVIVSTVISAIAEKLDTRRDDKAKADALKGQTGTGGSNSGNVKNPDAKAAASSEARSKLYKNLDSGLNSVITQALIESALWLLAMAEDQEFYSPFASDDSNADAKVDGDAKAESSEDGEFANLDNLENAILGVSLMQANISLLREIQGDRIQLASQMANSPASFLKKAITNAPGSALKNKIKADQDKQENQDLDDLADMDEDEFKEKQAKFLAPQKDAAEATEAAYMLFVDKAAADFDKKAEEKYGADYQKNPEYQKEIQGLKDASGKNLNERYTQEYGKDYLSNPKAKASYDKEVTAAKAASFLKDDVLAKDGSEDVANFQAGKDVTKQVFATQQKAASQSGLSADDQRRFMTLQKKFGVDSAENLYAKLQDDRAKKNQGDVRKNTGSTTLAEAQAGMASKEGLSGARKQMSEVAKLEKAQEEKALREIGVVDVGSLSDGDPGEGDPDKRENKKEKAKNDYLGADNVLNAKFYSLDGPAQLQALKDMGMSDDDAAPLLARIDAVKEGLKEPGDVAQIAALTAAGVSSEKAAEIVADIKELRELRALLKEAAEVGKVPDTEALQEARTTLKGTAQQLLRGGDNIAKYVGTDKRLNQKFYALDKEKQADTLIEMGLANTRDEAKALAASGTQAAQDEKMAAAKAKMAEIAAKQAARLDSKDASLGIQAAALQSGLMRGAEDLQALARLSGAGEVTQYLADDGSLQDMAGMAPGTAVPLVLRRGEEGASVAVMVSNKALETLDLSNPETQKKLQSLIVGMGDVSLVPTIGKMSQADMVAAQAGMSRDLSAVQRDLRGLSETPSGTEKGMLQALGRMEKIMFAKEVESLGAELLRREGAVSIEDLDVAGQVDLVLPGATLAEGFAEENIEFDTLKSNLAAAGLVDSEGKATDYAKSLGQDLREEIARAAQNGAAGSVFLNAGSLDAVATVLSGKPDEARQADVMARLQSAGLVDASGKTSEKLAGMSEQARNKAIDEALGVMPGALLMPGMEADRDAVRQALSGGAGRKDEIVKSLEKAGLIDKYGLATEATKGNSPAEVAALHAAIDSALGGATPAEKAAVFAVLRGTKNTEKKEAIQARLKEMLDTRPEDRQALRKEIEGLRSGKMADGLDKLSPEAKQKLKDAAILNADGSLNAKEVARLQADPEAADAVFASIAGIHGAALKSAVFGQAKEEKLKSLEKKLAGLEVEGLRAMGLDTELTPSARLRLAAHDANHDPKKVREILRAQAAAYREQALKEAEARDNAEDAALFSEKKPLASIAVLGLRAAGAIVTAGATELAMAINNLNKPNAVKKAEKEKEKDVDRAVAAKERNIDRVAAAKKFQEEVDQLVGVDANAGVAKGFVDSYKTAMQEADKNSKEAQKATKGTFERIKENYGFSFGDMAGGKAGGQPLSFLGSVADNVLGAVVGLTLVPTILSKYEQQDEAGERKVSTDNANTAVLKALVAERDAAVKIRKLVKEGDSAQAADILRHMAAGGADGQALAAGVLRRLAANGDDVRDLVDRAAEGARPDQLRGLGGAVVQAMGADARFKDLKIGEKDGAFDSDLGTLYGMSGWHANTDIDKRDKSKVDPLTKWWAGKATASAKSERGATAFADAIVGAKGLNKVLASASQKDLAGLGNLSKDKVSALLGQLSSDAKSRASDSFVSAIDSSVARDPDVDGDDVDRLSEDGRDAFSVDSESAPLLMEDLEIDIEDRAFGAPMRGPLSSDEVQEGISRRDTQMDAFERAFKQVMRKGPSLENAQAVSAALASVRDRGDVGEAVRLLSAAVESPGKSRLTEADKKTMARESGQLLVEVSEVLQGDLAADLGSADVADRDSLKDQSQSFVRRSKGLLTELDREGAENRRQAQQALTNVAKALTGLTGARALELQTVLKTHTNADMKTDGEVAALKAAVAEVVDEGLKAEFAETTVRSDYFKKLDKAAETPGYEDGQKVDNSVLALSEISQKLKQDPVAAGAELENVKDRVATVIEAAAGQGHVDDVLRVLSQLRAAGLTDLVKDLGALVAVRGDGDLALDALNAGAKSLVDTPEATRSAQQQQYLEGLSDFKIGVLDKDSRVVDKMVHAHIDTAKKDVALRQIANKMAAGDVALIEAVLKDSVLRQDLAVLVAQGVALDMSSAYRILFVLGNKNAVEAKVFAEEVGIRLSTINTEIKTASRQTNLKDVREKLQEMAKTTEEKTEMAAFSKQLEQGYGVQLYASAPLMGLSRSEKLQVLNTLVNTKNPQKAESIFRDLAMRNPQAAAHLMTDAMSYNMPTLANTMYQGISKEIPGANGRTLNQIQSLIKAFSAEAVPLGVALSSEYTSILGQMNTDMAAISSSQRDLDLPSGALLFNTWLGANVQVEGDTMSIPDGQKPVALAHVQQEASRMALQVADLPGADAGAEAFGKLKDNPAGMTPSDFGILMDLAGQLPANQAREMRMQLGVVALSVLPEGSPTRTSMMHQQVLDMAAVGHGESFSSQMFTEAFLAPGVSGKLDALESMLSADPDMLNLAGETAGLGLYSDGNVMAGILIALGEPGVNATQREALLMPGGPLDTQVGKQLDQLDMDAVIAFDQAQVLAGVSLSPSHFAAKLESAARKEAVIDGDAKGDAVKAAMAEVANGTQTMQTALTTLFGSGGALVHDQKLLSAGNRTALGEMKTLADVTLSAQALPELLEDVSDLEAAGGMAPPSVLAAKRAEVQAAKDQISGLLNNGEQSKVLQQQQPGLYLRLVSLMGTDTSADRVIQHDRNAVVAHQDAVQAYLDPQMTMGTVATMEQGLITAFMGGDVNAAQALGLIAAADAGLARPRLPLLLSSMSMSVDKGELAAKLQDLSGKLAMTNLEASTSLSKSATVLRDKAALGSHTALKDLAQKALRHHHKGQSYERELSAMSGHVQMHKESFVDAMKIAPYNLDQSAAEKAVDTNSSSEGGIPGMLTLLDAQERNLSIGGPSSADVRALKAAKMALAEVYIDTLIKDDSTSISSMDRQLATVLVDSLKEGMNEIMPRLKHRLQSSEATDRLMALIGQSNIPLTGAGGMGELRADLVKASGIFDMTSPASAAATLGIVQQDTDLAARTLALYTDPKDAAAVLNKLVAYQDGDAAFAGGLLGRMPEPNLAGPAAQNYWNDFFGTLDFANDVPSLAALRAGIQSPILAEHFSVYLQTLPGGVARDVFNFDVLAGLPTSVGTAAEKASLRVNVAMTMGQSLGALPGTMAEIKQEAMAMLSTPYADQSLTEMVANPQARAMLGRLVAEDPTMRAMVADIIGQGMLPASTLTAALKLPGVAAELRARPMETAFDGMLLAKVMVEPSLVSQLDASDLAPMTNLLLLSGDPMGVLPHLMSHPGAMEMIGSALMGGSSEISQDQALQLIGLARSGKDLGALLTAVPPDKLASVIGNPTFLEGRSDRMAMLDSGISSFIASIPDNPSVSIPMFSALSAILDSPTYGRNDVAGMSMDGVPKGVKVLIAKQMVFHGHADMLDPKHVPVDSTVATPIAGASENTSLIGSLEAGSPDIFLLEDALTAAAGDSTKLNSLIATLESAVSSTAPGVPNATVDFLTTSLLGKSTMIRLTAMTSTDSTVLEGLQTKLESANFNRLEAALNGAATPEAFTQMAQSGLLLSDSQKTALAEKFVTKYPAGSADAEAAMRLLFEA